MQSLLVIILLTGLAAHAKDDLLNANPCAADEERLCKKTDKPTINNDFHCLSLSFNSLQKGCQDFINTNLAHKPCTKDVATYCKGDDRNIDRWAKCLNSQLSKVSPGCSDWLSKAYSRSVDATKEIESVCAKDLKICRDLKGAAVGKCMDSLYSQGMLPKKCAALYETMRLKNIRR